MLWRQNDCMYVYMRAREKQGGEELVEAPRNFSNALPSPDRAAGHPPPQTAQSSHDLQ